MARWKGGRCPKCGRPVAQKVGEPAKPCPDCTAAHEEDDTVTRMLRLRNDELQAEVDALAAHVERLRREWEKRDAHEMSYREKLDALVDILYSETPTSLSRQKARWQAEAMDDAAEAFELEGCHIAAAQALRCSAAELRRQAWEGVRQAWLGEGEE